MLVLLDTTALMSDPTCGGVAWRILANAASAWNVQVHVPEVVLIEAIAGYQRRVAEAAVGLTRWADKHAGPLGLSDVHRISDRALADAASAYPARLREFLASLNAAVVEPPEVAHATLVERAASRRRPCDNQGDGYRDTLNWLTVLSLASEYPDQEIVWVSDNTQDFGTDDGTGLHEDLVAELAEVNADKRVRWIRTLPELVLMLAGEHAPGAPADLAAIQARLRDEALSAFIEAKVLAAAVGNPLSPRRCGLPTATISAKILAIGEANELHFTVRGSVADNEAIVEFDLEAETSIQIELLPGTTTTDVSSPSLPGETEAFDHQITKPLKFTGLITLDRYDRPIGGELTRITAIDDDAGLLQWATLDMRSAYSSLRPAPDPPASLLLQAVQSVFQAVQPTPDPPA
jgi:PIN domain